MDVILLVSFENLTHPTHTYCPIPSYVSGLH